MTASNNKSKIVVEIDARGQLLSSDLENLLEGMSFARKNEVKTVWVPSSKIMVFTKKTGIKGKDLRKALPFLCEESLLEDVENYEFKLVDNPSGEVVFYAVLKSDLNKWTGLVTECGLSGAILVPNFHRLPSSNLFYEKDEQEIVARTDLYKGFECDKSFNALFDSGSLAVTTEDELLDSSVINSSLKKAAINSHKASNVESVKEHILSYLKPVLVGVSALTFIYGYGVYSIASSELEASQKLKQASIVLYQDIFPGAKKIINPKAQAQAKLNQQLKMEAEKLGFSEALSQAYTSLNAVKGVKTQELSFSTKERKLTLKLIFDSNKSKINLEEVISHLNKESGNARLKIYLEVNGKSGTKGVLNVSV